MTVDAVATLDWTTCLGEEKEKPYFQKALQFVQAERRSGKIVYPASQDVFNAFRYTPLDKLRVVILGQDPYHGPNQAHGLCFSVRPGVPHPPSLRNILTELQQDCGIPYPQSGSLEPWAKQGVLLLNTVLTVEAGKAHSHADIGWEQFTDNVISVINEHCQGVIFLLWGSHAQRKGQHIDAFRHHVLKAPHPSPLSAYRGFMGCHHFSKTNTLLEQHGQKPIDWTLE